MSKVRIVQLLCPARHCYVATVYESPDGEPMAKVTADLMNGYKDLLEKGANPWCGICGSRNLQAEDRATRFATMREAAPAFAECAADQARTREFFRTSKG